MVVANRFDNYRCISGGELFPLSLSWIGLWRLSCTGPQGGIVMATATDRTLLAHLYRLPLNVQEDYQLQFLLQIQFEL
jgi:hypothetical protein